MVLASGHPLRTSPNDKLVIGAPQSHQKPLTGPMTKLISAAVVLLVAVFGGWLWGASGRWSVERVQQSLELRQDLVEGRSALLDARLDLYSVNFGDASRHLENARGLLGHADQRLKSLGRDDEVKDVEMALAAIDDAQRLAGKLDQNANSRAGDAAKILSNVLDAVAKQ
jgi:hypothetical protein